MLPNRLRNVITYIIAQFLRPRPSIKPISTVRKLRAEQWVHHPLCAIRRGCEEEPEDRMKQPNDPEGVEPGRIDRAGVDVDKRHVRVTFALHLEIGSGVERHFSRDSGEMDRL